MAEHFKQNDKPKLMSHLRRYLALISLMLLLTHLTWCHYSGHQGMI